MKDKHVIEALGKTEVVIENGKVTSVGDPLIDYCPIFDKIDNAKQLDKDFIKWNIEKRIREFGMCTANRVVKMPDMMSFGISEILKTNKELESSRELEVEFQDWSVPHQFQKLLKN